MGDRDIARPLQCRSAYLHNLFPSRIVQALLREPADIFKENTKEPGITSFRDNQTRTAYVEKGDAQGLITPGDDPKARFKQSILI